jgi:hypothetical protein
MALKLLCALLLVSTGAFGLDGQAILEQVDRNLAPPSYEMYRKLINVEPDGTRREYVLYTAKNRPQLPRCRKNTLFVDIQRIPAFQRENWTVVSADWRISRWICAARAWIQASPSCFRKRPWGVCALVLFLEGKRENGYGQPKTY